MRVAARYGEAASYAQAYRALLAVSNALIAHRDVTALVHALAAALDDVVEFDFLALALYDPAARVLRLRAQVSDHTPSPLGATFPIEDSPSGWVWRTQQQLVVPNVAEEGRWPSFIDRMPRAYGIQSFCDLPLSTARTRLGTLAFGASRVGCYGVDDVEFMQQVANQVALAVENALSFGEIAELKDRLQREKVCLEEELRADHNFKEIVGQSQSLKTVLSLAEIVAPTGATVLIRGETGTGKELVARAIHTLSDRRERSFVKVNCAAIPMGLFESELFGHEKGAFTGAIQQRIGRFELAHQGTVFLDEVGDIPLELQPKLLRMLQEQEFERLGSSRTIRVDVRLVTATNRDLARMVAQGEFRMDLYYRLNVFPLVMPPLRERREDIPSLIRHFTRHFALRMGKRIETIPEEVMEAMCAYAWPGNVRELENLIERAVILSRTGELRLPAAEPKPSDAAQDVVTLADAERGHILRVLRETNWVLGGQNGAAARLGMRRSTLQWKMKKLGIARF